jgi:hypothetical protein
MKGILCASLALLLAIAGNSLAQTAAWPNPYDFTPPPARYGYQAAPVPYSSAFGARVTQQVQEPAAQLTAAQQVPADPDTGSPFFGVARLDDKADQPAEKLPPPAGAAAAPTINRDDPARPAADLTARPTSASFTEGPAADCSRIWASGEYLLWWIKDSPLPVPLVTTGPAGSLSIIGNPGTAVVFGNQSLDYGTFSGGRVTAGGWLDSGRVLGFEASAFLLERRAQYLQIASANGIPPLAIPYVDTAGTPSSIPFAISGRLGAAQIGSSAQLWSADAVGLLNLSGNDRWSWDLIGGFNYLDLSEKLDMTFREATLAAGGFISQAHDRFDARNQFYGGRLGSRVGVAFGRLSFEATGTVDLGSMHEVVDIQGDRFISGGGFNRNTGAGIFAQQSNIGRHVQDQFAVIPQVQVQAAAQLTTALRATVGYNFLYIDRVVRPGNTIDSTINALQDTLANHIFLNDFGPGRPASISRQSDFWAQGVSFGLEFRY